MGTICVEGATELEFSSLVVVVVAESALGWEGTKGRPAAVVLASMSSWVMQESAAAAVTVVL